MNYSSTQSSASEQHIVRDTQTGSRTGNEQIHTQVDGPGMINYQEFYDPWLYPEDRSVDNLLSSLIFAPRYYASLTNLQETYRNNRIDALIAAIPILLLNRWLTVRGMVAGRKIGVTACLGAMILFWNAKILSRATLIVGFKL